MVMKRVKAYGSCRAMINLYYRELIELSCFHQTLVGYLFVLSQLAVSYEYINSVD